MLKKSMFIGTSLLAVAAFTAPAFAQTDEIIITATKKETTLQDTPVSVNVTGADVIEKAQILDIKDLQSVVPTFRVSQLQNSANTSLSIRGFGNGGNNKGIEPAVGVFIDGVYRSRAAAQIGDLPNLERVEVLSGPQTTLFGKNASAGVVSVVTSAPSYDFGGYVEGGLGNYNLYQVRGYVEGGLSDNVAASIGGSYQQRDGYFEDQTGNSGDLNDLDRYNLRGQLLFEPNDDLSVRLIADMSKLDENCCGTGVAIENADPLTGVPARVIVQSLGGNQPSADNQFAYDTYLNRGTKNVIEDSGISAEVTYDWNDVTFTSITSFRQNDNKYNSDNDFNSLEFLKDVYEDVSIETFTQEFRINTSLGDRASLMAGAYYFDESINQNSGLIYGDDTRIYLGTLAGGVQTFELIEAANGFAPGTFFADDTLIDEYFTQDNEAYSFFGTVDFDVTDRLTVTGGLNYTEDEKQVTAFTNNDDVFGNLDLTGPVAANSLVLGGYLENFPLVATSCGLGPLAYTPANIGAVLAAPACQVAPGVFAPGSVVFPGFQQQVQAGVAALDLTDPAQNPLLGLTALQFQPQFLAFPNAVEDGMTKDDDLTYSLRASFEVNDNISVFAGTATGFKSSSWNLTRDSRPFLADGMALAAAGLLPNNYVPATGRNFGTRFALPESAEVYEIGIKARFERGAFNVTLFDQTIENFQSTIFQGTGFVLANAGEQSTTGIEFDSTFDPTDNLTLTFAGMILDPVYDSFPGAPGPNGPTDLSGEKPAGIPELSLSTSATYNMDLGSGRTGFIRGDWQYESEVQVVDNIEGIDRQVSLFNASAGIDFDNGLAIKVWSRNLFNDEFYTSAFPGVVQGGTSNVYPNQPRTYGVTVRKNF